MKSILLSKTFWFGILQILSSAGPLVSTAFPPSTAIALGVSGVATIVLRTLTNQAVTFTLPQGK